MLIPHFKRLDGSRVPQYCATSESIVSNECPSSEWQSLAAFETITNNSNPWAGYKLYHAMCLPYATQLTGRNSIRQFITGIGRDFRLGAIPKVAVSTTQQSVIADALTNTAILWDIGLVNATSSAAHGSPFSDQRAATHTVKSNYYQPYAAASCSGRMKLNMTEGSPLIFPVSAWQGYQAPGNTTVPTDDGNTLQANGTEYYGMSPTQILDIPRSSHRHYRLKWVEFQEDLFNSTTIGAIVLLPRKTAESPQFLYTCTMAAGWGNSSLSTSSGFSVEPVLSQHYFSILPQQRAEWPKFSQLHQSSFQQNESQVTFDMPYYPERPINITSDWADYLNPFMTGSNTTAFNTLMSLPGLTIFPTNERASYMLVALMTNGLARVGFKNRLQGSLKTFTDSKSNDTELDGNYWLSGKGDVFSVDPVESKDWVKLFVESSIQGYTYNTSGAAPKVAIAFLLAYCAFALSHVLYAGYSGTKSLLPPPASRVL